MDAGDDEAAHAGRRQPVFQPRPDEGAVPALVDDRVGADAERLQRDDEPGGFREGALVLDVEDLDDRHPRPHRPVDESLLTRQVGREIGVGEIGTVAEGFLGIDHEEGAVVGGHVRTPLWRGAMTRS